MDERVRTCNEKVWVASRLTLIIERIEHVFLLLHRSNVLAKEWRVSFFARIPHDENLAWMC